MLDVEVVLVTTPMESESVVVEALPELSLTSILDVVVVVVETPEETDVVEVVVVPHHAFLASAFNGRDLTFRAANSVGTRRPGSRVVVEVVVVVVVKPNKSADVEVEADPVNPASDIVRLYVPVAVAEKKSPAETREALHRAE